MNAVSELQATLDASRKSWIEAANHPDCDFSIQNLPFGIFSDAHNAARRTGVAIGESIVDLSVLHGAGLLSLPARLATSSRVTRSTFSSSLATKHGAQCGSS